MVFTGGGIEIHFKEEGFIMGMARRKFRLGWFGLLFLASVLMFGCGGGGGDDGGGGGSPAPDVPEILSYGVGAANINPVPLLPYGTRFNGAAFAFTTLQLSGVINRGVDPISITLDDYNDEWDILNGVQFTYNPSPAVLGGGAIIVRITIPNGVTIRWLSGSDPSEGSFVVSIVNAQGETLVGPFRVEIAPNRPGGAGVNIYNAQNQLLSSLAWDGFKNAETNPGSNNYEALPSLAYNMLQATYRWLSQGYTLLSIVVEYDSLLQQQQVASFTTTSFPGLGAGPANITVQWLDQDGNSDLGPDDGFMSNLSFWWDDVAEFLYNGHLRIIDYWENSGAAGNNYVGGNFRFGPDNGPSDFTEQDGSNNVLSPDRTTVGGSVFFLVYW
jgi:hypothetical protein